MKKSSILASFLSAAVVTIPSSSLFAVALSANVNSNSNNNNNANPNNLTKKIKNAPLALSEELGCSPTLTKILMKPFAKGSSKDKKNTADTQFYFDPLGLARDDTFGRYREAELKHGRVSMVVVVIALVESLSGQKDPIAYLASGQTPKLWELFQHELARENAWIILPQALLVCGILETLLLVQASPQDMPGDYGVGYFGIRDKGQNERSLISELENGRLAMMTLLYWLIMELVMPSLTEASLSFSFSTKFQEFFSGVFLAVLGDGSSGANNNFHEQGPLAAAVSEIMATTTSIAGMMDGVVTTTTAASTMAGIDDVVTTTATAATSTISEITTATTTSIGIVDDVVTTTATAAATSIINNVI